MSRYALGFSPRGTCVGSRYGHPGSHFPAPFSRAPRIDRTHQTAGHSRLRPVLSITELPGLLAVRWGDGPTRSIPERQKLSLRCRGYLVGSGILTGFPFGGFWLRATLGPTNPRLTIIVEEPEPLRRLGFSPNFAATTARILVPTWSIRPHGRTSAHAGRLPTGSVY